MACERESRLLECVLDRHLTYGEELVAFGRIVAGSVDADALSANDPYAYLRMFVFLEEGVYGVIKGACKVSRD